MGSPRVRRRPGMPHSDVAIVTCATAFRVWSLLTKLRVSRNFADRLHRTNLRRKPMAEDINKGQMRSGENVPGPDVMLGMWASWMDQMTAPGQASAGRGKPWWQMTTDAPAPHALAGGVQQLEE